MIVEIKEKHNCSICGRPAEKLYQDNTCKHCLQECFMRLRPFIDSYRIGKTPIPANLEVCQAM